MSYHPRKGKKLAKYAKAQKRKRPSKFEFIPDESNCVDVEKWCKKQIAEFILNSECERAMYYGITDPQLFALSLL